MRLNLNLGIFVIFVSSLIDISISEPRVVCYYTNWSVYRPGTAKFNPQNINPYLCTHLVYAFGGFTKDNQLKPFDKYQDIEQGGYAKFTGLKTYNKDLKTMLAIGGWNEGSTRFSPLVGSADRRAQLVKNAIKFLRQNKFDGLDLDWEYPAFRDGGKAKDRENYAKLVQELREEFDREHQKTGRPRLLLTMAVPAGFEYIDKGYDVPKLNKYLDWFNLLSYDYHSAYEPSVNHHAPLYPIEEENEYSYDNDLNINATINYYLKNGAERDKLVLGIPTYGRSYTLFNPDSNEIGAPADGPGEQGDATREKGYLAYYEICQSLKEEDSDWTVVQPNPDALGPYAFNENQWVGYDDEEIVRRKSEFVVEQKLGGIMFWSIDNDDFRGLCNGKPYPLIEAAKESYLDGLENGVQKKTQSASNKRKHQQTTTKRSDTKKSGKTTTPAPPTTPKSGSDFKCEEEGFYPHPSDCKKYFWCLEAPGLGIVAHHFSCPSGLLFNKAADSCDYARNVFCTIKTPTTTPATTTTTRSTTTTEASTTEKVTYSKVTSFYKSPSRTTPRTTTIAIDEIDTSDLEQEDPKVIKELIELIKKAGGIEELEKQINIQEDSSLNNLKSYDQKSATTPTATTINKSLVDKIRNRASLFKPRPPLFNGASQAERVVEQKESSTTTQKSVKNEETSKKYNSINRFSRPQSQNDGIAEISESDAVLIEKPQYTTLKRKPVKPEVIAENDYNNDPDRKSSVAENSKSVGSDLKKYTNISRTRKPQVPVVEESEEDDDEESDEEIAEKPLTTTRAPSKYVNFSRRRSTTSEPEEEKPESTTLSTTSTSTTQSTAARRRVISTTSQTTTQSVNDKTVLKIDTNRDTLENTLFKKITTDIEQETLIANKHIHDDDNDNHIALPTESVTENLPYPETITTTTTHSPSSVFSQINSNINQVNDLLNDNESATENSNNSDFDFTTIINENNDDNENGLSKKNYETFVENKKTNSIAPRPFSRKILPTRDSSFASTKNIPLSSAPLNDFSRDVKKILRSRPTISRTTTTTTEEFEYDASPRPTYSYSYRPGYRGTARFRYSTARSGEYDRELNNQKFIDDNRLRSLNIDRPKRPISEVTERTSTTTTEERSTRSRPSLGRTRPTTTTRAKTTTKESIDYEDDLELTTEQRILEAKNRFNLNGDERPDRIRFELTAGGKINFGFKSVKSRENATQTEKEAESDSSKVKVITGPLEKSPVISSRNSKPGIVEEIPIIRTSPQSVTVRNFSNKLDLSEIPLNKSDIDSFVSDTELRTDLPIEDTTAGRKSRLRPSKIGFRKRPLDDNDVTTVDTLVVDDEIDDTTTSKPRLRTSQGKFVSKLRGRVESDVKNELSDEISSRRTVTRTRIPQRGRTKIKNEESTVSDEQTFVIKTQLRPEQNERFETSSPRGFQNRFSSRSRKTDISPKEESTTSKYLTKIRASLFKINSIADSENSETQDAPEESTLRTRIRPSKKGIEGRFTSQEILDLITEEPSNDDENEIDFTTQEISEKEEETTNEAFIETTPRSQTSTRRVVIRKRPAKKLDILATRQTITEPSNDDVNVDTTIGSFAGDNEDDYETEIETASFALKAESTLAATRPTRRFFTRKRILPKEDNDVDQIIENKESTTPKTTTRKRILTIRTKTGVIHSPVEIRGDTVDTAEPSTEASLDDNVKNDEPDVIRKRVKVFRSRATTERSSEEISTQRTPYTRTKIYRRPVVAQSAEESSTAIENESTSPRSSSSSRFNGRRVIKVSKRPLTTASVESESESERAQEGDIIIESSTSTPRRRVTKIFQTKTPRVVTDKALEEDTAVIKNDDESQQIDDLNEEVIQKEEVEIENVKLSSEEPARPNLKYPTRPGGKVSVTVKRRPAFTQGVRSTTIHPASTRFAKEGNVPIRKQVTRRRFGKINQVTSTESELSEEKKVVPKKIFTKVYRTKFSTTSAPPNIITPHLNDTESETNNYDDDVDTTEISQSINNDDILQSSKPRFSLTRYTTSTTPKPTTLHHVFAIDIGEEDMNKLKNMAQHPEDQADEVIKKLQKLIEINRIVEVYSKEEKLKLLKNKKLKSIKAGELTVERPPALDKFGEVSRQIIIKLVKATTTTEKPSDARSPKNVMFAETIFGNAETSTISLEGLFDREKKELEIEKNESSQIKEIQSAGTLLRPELNETNPIVISIANLDKVILSKVRKDLNGDEIEETTESIVNETTTFVKDDD